MNTKIEIQLIEQAKQNIADRSTSLRGSIEKGVISRYVEPERYADEIDKVFKQLPSIVAHSTEVADSNSYQVVNSVFGSLIISRDHEGLVHVFFNICRHRGAKLVEGKGCTKRLMCPYHAWTYRTDGTLIAVPDEANCFPTLDKSQNSLISIPAVEKYGFIWICPATTQTEAEQHLADHLDEMAANLTWMKGQELKFFSRTSQVWNGNWKLFAEGGLETYHFSFAHKNSIGPYFQNNIAVIDQIQQHFRVVMPMKSLKKDTLATDKSLSLHEYSHTLFFLLPDTALLVQKAHVDWIKFRPISPNQTEISVTSLIPESANLEDIQQQNHWYKNLQITDKTLSEDWSLGASIQASMESGALPHIQYGKNEWALHALNQRIDSLIDQK